MIAHWRCFHCGEAFTKGQHEHARDHFGWNSDEQPVCLIREPGEYPLLRLLRKMQLELDQRRAEDTLLHHALHSMAADHGRALIAAEQAGYDKGLKDGRETAP